MLSTTSALPLSGKTIVVTRAAHQVNSFQLALEKLGAQVIPFSTITIMPISDTTQLEHALKTLHQADWVIFTSMNGVQATLDRLPQLDRLAKTKFAVVGHATASALMHYGLKPTLLPEKAIAESLFDALLAAESGVLTGKQIVLCRADRARSWLPDTLTQHGALVQDICVYQTQPITEHPHKSAFMEMLANHHIDFIAFTSGSAVQGLAQVLADADITSLLQPVQLASIGPIASQAIQHYLNRPPDLEATTYSIAGLIDTLVSHIQLNEGASPHG